MFSGALCAPGTQVCFSSLVFIRCSLILKETESNATVLPPPQDRPIFFPTCYRAQIPQRDLLTWATFASSKVVHRLSFRADLGAHLGFKTGISLSSHSARSKSTPPLCLKPRPIEARLGGVCAVSPRHHGDGGTGAV